MISVVQERGNDPVQEGEVGQQKQQKQRQQQWQQRQQQGQEVAETIDDPSKGLDQTLALLAAKDDTSRFVGLALLKSTLENKIEFQKDPEIIKKCWEAIPSRFLDRLLKAGVNNEKSKDEARYMLELAVAVLHAFIVLLPDYIKRSKKSVDRIPGLLDALARSPSDSKTLILQVLLTLASTEDGSIKLLQSSAWPRLVGITDEQNLVLDIVKYTIIVASRNQLGYQNIQKASEATISALLVSFKDTSMPTGFFEALVDIVTAVPDEALSLSPTWLPLLADLLIKYCLSRHSAASAENRHGLSVLTATMLRLYPQQFPSLLFNGATSSPESKPNSFLFIKLMIVDIRSSIPSLQEILNSPHYPRTCTRIACSYDIISAFVGHLVHILDQEDSPSSVSKIPLIFSPSLLLQLRADISETISLTIEHLRDRFDASVAGALGLHPSARSRTEATPTAPLAITWDSSFSPMLHDHLTLAQIRTLALWLHEDDNDTLRKEAAGIMDLILSLYTSKDAALQFRSPVLMGLESIIIVPEGVDVFLAADGWSILAKDLQTIVLSNSLDDTQRGIDIVRVLLEIVQSDVTGPAKEDWMDLVKLAAHPPSPNSTHDVTTLDLRIAVAQLAVELLVQAPRGVRRKNLASAARLLRIMRAMRNDNSVAGETRDGLEEVVSGLEELGII